MHLVQCCCAFPNMNPRFKAHLLCFYCLLGYITVLCLNNSQGTQCHESPKDIVKVCIRYVWIRYVGNESCVSREEFDMSCGNCDLSCTVAGKYASQLLKASCASYARGLRSLQRSTGPFADRSLCLLCAGL